MNLTVWAIRMLYSLQQADYKIFYYSVVLMIELQPAVTWSIEK